MKKLQGKIPPQRHADEDIQKAGIYVNHQRTKYHEGKLSLQLQERLAKLPNWTWDDVKKTKRIFNGKKAWNICGDKWQGIETDFHRNAVLQMMTKKLITL